MFFEIGLTNESCDEEVELGDFVMLCVYTDGEKSKCERSAL